MSMSNISNKWKRFAIEQVLSDWNNVADHIVEMATRAQQCEYLS